MADLAPKIAASRKAVAKATPGPRWESLGGVLFSGDTCIGSISLNGKGHVYNLSDGDCIVLAVNSLPALLDVAEAAMENMEEDSDLGRGVDPALADALARLAEVLS